MDQTELQKLRIQRLRILRDRIAGGNAALLARMAGYGETYFRNMLSGRKSMGEKTARKIEENLKLFPGYLDIPPEKEEIFQIFDALKQVDESQYWQVMQLVQILRDGPRKQ